ncbi:MAG TPA: cysteine peptidase family C39 domain-containing protein [Sedimentisphaerales bacterium]|nr:cysteine peptidase family C39 domain-containing protein [Sedimentisphaerales bacterium]
MAGSKVVALIAATCLAVASVVAFAEGGDGAVSSGLDEGSRRGLIFPDYKEAFRIRRISATACGPLSLIAVLKRMDIPLSGADVKNIIGSAGSKGTNLQQLKQLAEGYGVYALGVELTTQELRRTGMYAIAHLDWARFVAVTGYSQKGIQVVRPLKKAAVVSDERFSKAFTGRALLISRVPFPKELVEAGSVKPDVRGLRLSQSSIGVGRIRSVDWEKSVGVYNDGTGTIEVKVKPCCASISARVEPNVVPGGGSAVLTVAGKEKEPGQFQWSVSLLTNQKDVKPIKVPVQGYLEPPLFFETPAVKLTNVLQNQEAEAHARFICMDGVRIDDLVA